jgi:hypothetical protein
VSVDIGALGPTAGMILMPPLTAALIARRNANLRPALAEPGAMAINRCQQDRFNREGPAMKPVLSESGAASQTSGKRVGQR